MIVLNWLLHVLGADSSSTRWYYFWSAFGSGPLAWCVLPLVYWRHHNCHTRHCWRLGHLIENEVRCRKHKKGSPQVTASAEGKDFSDFQPVQTVAELQALDFAFFKATEGTGWTGQTFGTQPDGSPGNWANARKAGIPRGAYHFLHPGEDATAQAKHFLAVIKAAGGLVPGDMLVVDTEVFDGLTGAQVDAATKAFLDAVKARINPAHQPMIVYTMHEVGQYLKHTANAYPLLWFAWPSSSAPPASLIAPWPVWRFWQWGTVGGVDADAYNGTVKDLAAWIKSYTNPVRPVTVIITDGKQTLAGICKKHNDRIAAVVARTLAHGLHPRLLAYMAKHPLGRAPMPKGIHLRVATGTAA